MISLENNFRSLDDDNSQTINFDSFAKTAKDFKFGLSFDEVEKLFNFLDKEQNCRIDYDEFIRLLRGQMSNSRKNLIEKIFSTFEPDKDGYVHIKKINQFYNPENHPDALTGKRNPDEIYKEFVDTFEGNHNYLNGDEAHYGTVDLDEFLDYYDSVSMIVENDSEFENIVRGVWLNEINKNYINQEEERSKPLRARKVVRQKESPNKNEYEDEKDNENLNNEKYEDENEQNKEVNKAFESFKKYLQQKDAKTVLTLARQFKIMDENGNKTLDFGEFRRGIRNSGLDIPDKVLEELFNEFDYDGSGFISHDEFMVKLLGNLNARREAVVRAAFDKLDIDKSGFVDLNEIKTFYNTKNSPQVLNGEIDEEKLYAHFIETFGNHHNLYSGIRDKRVTWKEFLNYYRFVSFNIPDDDLFEAIIKSAWKLDNTGEYLRDEDLKSQKKLEQALEKKESMKGRKNETSIRGGGAPFGVDREPTDYSTSNMMNNENNKKLRGRKSNNYEEERENLRENKNKNQIFDSKYNSQTDGESALNNFKDIIKKRGPRGILGMRRCFMIFDDDNSKSLTFENFEKYINNFLIPLSRNQVIALFKLYDKQNSGVINYDSLINDVVGQISDSRRNIVYNAFNKLDIDKKGVINMNVIRGGFNPKGHPDYINRKRTEDEILAEFLDNFDYHFNLLNPERNPNDEEVTNREFIDFYRNISAGIEDDSYFNRIITGVWGLSNQINSARRYY